MPQRRADLESPAIKPYLSAFGIPTDIYPVGSYAPDHAHLNTSQRPHAWQTNQTMGISGMPVPGYQGHLPLTKGNATENFGTSFFRPNQPASRRAQAAHAHAFARERGALSGADLTLSPTEREHLSC